MKLVHGALMPCSLLLNTQDVGNCGYTNASFSLSDMIHNDHFTKKPPVG